MESVSIHNLFSLCWLYVMCMISSHGLFALGIIEYNRLPLSLVCFICVVIVSASNLCKL
uniref:Uncharacterized protein n=1 Tax=Aegilops tauschii subsp. strangulata TaxID=200361 RepID=A0A453JA50_AEGTS